MLPCHRALLVGLSLGLLPACNDGQGPDRAEPFEWPEQSCPAGSAELTWRTDGREPIAGAGQGFVLGDRVLVRGERPGQVGWYDVPSGAFLPLPDPPVFRAGSAVAIDGTGPEGFRLFSVGGHVGPQALDDGGFWAYDASRAGWLIGTSLPEGRSGASACLDGEQLLLFGGTWSVTSGASSLVYRHALAEGMTGAWQELDTMPEPRARASAIVIGRRVYLVGGDLGNFGDSPAAVASSTLVYDLDARAWATLPGLLTPRRWPALAWLCDRLIAVGGARGDNSPLAAVEAFDPGTQTWSAMPDLPERRQSLGLVEHRGALVSVASKSPFTETAARLVSRWSARPLRSPHSRRSRSPPAARRRATIALAATPVSLAAAATSPSLASRAKGALRQGTCPR